MTARKNWIDVDLDGLRKLLDRRGKEFAIYELTQNAWDENITRVDIELTRPVHGWSELIVTDDSPEGFRDLTDSFTMYKESSKKASPQKRGAFNLGEKFVLALCDTAQITSTTGRVIFDDEGRMRSRVKRAAGTEFWGSLPLTLGEYDAIVEKTSYLIPPVPTIFNGVEIPSRTPLNKFEAHLATMLADDKGRMRPRKRKTTVRVYEPLPGEAPMLYEMGIPVVETGDRYHVDIGQKVPLNMERDNVTPAFLRAVRVAVVNAFGSQLDDDVARENWVREAASDKEISPNAFRRIIEARFGDQAVIYDPSDIGSNREAASKHFTVVTGGSLNAGEWENVRKTAALLPAGRIFATHHGSKTPDKRYSRDEWTDDMQAYVRFVEEVSPALVGYRVTLEYINDKRMVCGQFFGTWFNVNLAVHDVSDWQSNLELMLHELAHTVVKSNDHLSHEFYNTVGRLGAKLAIHLASDPSSVSNPLRAVSLA
jgi:hypothetical protein